MNHTTSYTFNLVDSMINGLITQKTSHGFRTLPNGLLEDIIGQVYTVSISQSHTKNLDGDECQDVLIRLSPVDVASTRRVH
jgi:hypothetical protein